MTDFVEYLESVCEVLPSHDIRVHVYNNVYILLTDDFGAWVSRYDDRRGIKWHFLKKHWYEMKHVLTMYMGKFQGWWELSWDLWPEDDNVDLIPIELIEVDFNEDDIMSKVLTDLGIFKSNKDAKRNGWNKTMEKGDHFFNKKTRIVRVV